MQGLPHDSPYHPSSAEPAATRTAPDVVATSGDGGWAWYLYGIWRASNTDARGLLATTTAALAAEPDAEPDGQADQQPLELIASGELQALTRRVPLADFSPEAISAHADDPAWLELSARRHNAVVEAAQRARTLLPAKFGSVYPRAEDVRAALLERHDALRDHLIWLDGCDEWAVHLYGDLASLRQRAEQSQEESQEQGGVGSAREQLASASPGRAYFLRRKLADELADATERLLDDLIAQALEAFARHARAAELARRMSSARLSQLDAHQDREQDQDGAGVEIMQATVLVPRDTAEAFSADVAAFAQREPGLWSEQSGPWAPYSFAAVPVESGPPDAAESFDASDVSERSGFGEGA